MNWLAHLYLSEPNPEFRLGNLLADIATDQSLASLSITLTASNDCAGVQTNRAKESGCDGGIFRRKSGGCRAHQRHRWKLRRCLFG